MKYIIDVPDTEGHYDSEYEMVTMRVHYGSTIVDISMDAKPYTEPDRSVIEDEVWGVCKKLISMSENEVSDMMGCMTNFGEVMYNVPYQEAKNRYEEWKKQKGKLHVGDVVVHADDPNKEKMVVLRLYQPPQYKPIADVLCEDGTVVKTVVVKNLVWTGRHFSDIEELLKKMREE